MSAVIGIDISKATFDAYLDHKSVSRYEQFANTTAGFQALEEWIEDTCEIEWICLEATGRYGLALSQHLHEAGYRISRVNPLRIKAFADSQLRRNKTDKSDAQLIAQFARVSDIPRWKPKSKPMSRLQQRTRHVQALKKTLQQEKNRLQSGLTDPVVTQTIQAHIAYLEQTIAALRDSIQQLIQQDNALQTLYRLVTSIPGIGAKSAPPLLAEIGDVHRFSSARQLAAYAGITPAHHRSGTSIYGETHISKRGNRHLRAVLYMPALSAKHHNAQARDLAKRLSDRGKEPMSITIAVAHKLLRQVYGVLKHKQPYDPSYEDKQAKAA